MKKVFVFFLAGLLLVAAAGAGLAAKQGTLGFGVTTLNVNGTNIGIPSAKYYFSKDVAGEVGATFTSVASNNTAGILASVTNDFMTMDKVKLHWGGGLLYGTAPNFNSFTVEGIVGAEVFIFSNVSFNIDVAPIAYTSINNAGAQTSAFQIGSATGTIFTSFHVYL